MMTVEEQELLTRVGPGTPGGDLLRRYWHPVALAEEILPGMPPLPLRIMGEDLVLFRDGRDALGLLQLNCPHRGADLSYARVEDGGLRCVYHGWLFDRTGACLDQPGEPAESTFADKVRATAYPVRQQANMIFAYMGPGEPPELPAYEALMVPDAYRFVWKHSNECSYLQGNEGNIDPVHLSYLHRFRQNEYTDRDVRFMLEGVTKDTAPLLEVEEADFGLRIFTVRHADDDVYVRVTHFIMPNLCAVAGFTSDDGYLINWHVPIDDEHHWKFSISFRRSEPLDLDLLRGLWEREFPSPDYTPVRNPENRYRQDRQELDGLSFAGFGPFIPVHDLMATETAGRIQDRSVEHLGTTDKAITQSRRMLLRGIKQIEDGADPPHVVREPGANRFSHIAVVDKVIPSSTDWRTHWQTLQKEQEQLSPATR